MNTRLLQLLMPALLIANTALAQNPLDDLKKKYENDNRASETRRAAVADRVHSNMMKINAVCLMVDGSSASLAFQNRGGRDFSAIYTSSGGDRWKFTGQYQSGRFAFSRSELIRDRPNTLYAESKWVIRFEVREDGTTWMALPERAGSSKYQEAVRVDCGLPTDESTPSNSAISVPADQAPISCVEGERRISHILVEFNGDPSSPEGSEALMKANGIVGRLRAGESFSAVARAESADIGSAAGGGDLGCIKRGDSQAEFERVAFGARVGEITDPVFVRSQGYSIIRVLWASE